MEPFIDLTVESSNDNDSDLMKDCDGLVNEGYSQEEDSEDEMEDTRISKGVEQFK